MKKSEDLLAMYRIANYYYNDNLSQNEIAKIEGVSRSQISRLLILARERGIVEINIKLPDASSIGELEERLRALLGLERVLVCETSAALDDEASLLGDVTTFAAAMLPELFGGDELIGVGRGRTIYNISLRLPVTETEPRKLFVPLTGNSGTRINALQTSSIVNRFADKFCADAFYINAPCIQPAERAAAKEGWLDELEEYWSRLDGAIISLGKPSVTLASYFDEIPTAFFDGDALESAVGEIIGQPFSDEGALDLFSGADGYRYIGMRLEGLKRVKNAVCVASGSQKLTPIIAASRLGFYKTLITDKLTAAELLKAIG